MKKITFKASHCWYLGLLALGLSFAVLTTGCKKPLPEAAVRTGWPTEDEGNKIAAAVSSILTKSAVKDAAGAALRRHLTSSSIAAKEAVQGQLDACYGQGAVVLPSQLQVLFVEFQSPGGNIAPSPSTAKTHGAAQASHTRECPYGCPKEGWAMIINLPLDNGKTHRFSDHYRGEYPVWAPTVVDDPCDRTSPSPSP